MLISAGAVQVTSPRCGRCRVGLLDELGVAGIIDEVAAIRCGRERGRLPGPGGTEPDGGAVLQAGAGGLVGEDGGAAVHQDPGQRA